MTISNTFNNIGGHPIHYDELDDEWKYSDTNESINAGNDRPCIKCGEQPTCDGHDACIANLGHVVNACCGHGVGEGYVQFDNGVILRGYFRVERNVEYGKLCEEVWSLPISGRCNYCGGELDEFDMQQNFNIHTIIGYGSRHDGDRVDLKLCCECFDKLVDGCTISPIIEEVR